MGSRIYRLIIIDDHAVMRDGLRELFGRERDMEVVAEATNADEAVERCHALRPDAALVDISLGSHSGLQLVTELRRALPLTKILILSMHDEFVFAERALRSGANGYVMKDQNVAVIVAALRRVLEGKTYVSEAVGERIFQSLSNGVNGRQARSGIDRLSDRELEVLRLIGQGQRTRAIAEALHVTTKTVETHRARIKEKLGLESASELMHAAMNWTRDGFLEPSTE